MNQCKENSAKTDVTTSNAGIHNSAQVISPLLEWRIGENECDWQQTQVSPLEGQEATLAHPITPRSRLHRSLLLSLPIVLLLVAVGWKWRMTQVRMAQVETELRQSVSAGQWAANVRVEIVELVDDKALVRVFAQSPLAPTTYRMTRVYLHSAKGWQPIPATAALWGRAKRLETEHFVFDYRARDAEAVEKVAAQLDALYRRFYGSFFAGLPPHTSKMSITINPEIDAPAQSDEQLMLPSPTTALAPARFSEADLLLRALTPLLIDQLSKEAVHLYAHPPYADSYAAAPYLARLTDAVRLWQLAKVDLPAQLWQSASPASDLAFLSEYTLEICAMRQAQIKALVSEAPSAKDESEMIEKQYDPCAWAWRSIFGIHWRLSQTLAFIPQEANPVSPTDMEQIGQFPPAQATVVLATVFDYAAATYGAERLPLLLASYGRLRSWESLVAAVYGVSAADFEAGWQSYLASHFKGPGR